MHLVWAQKSPRLEHQPPFTMKLFSLFFLILGLAAFPAGAQNKAISPQTSELLKELDEIVANKTTYQEQRNEQIAKLRNQAQRSSGISRILFYKEIFTLYSHYRTDSAQVYLDLLSQMPESQTDKSLQAYIHIGQAEILSIMGLYSEAEAELRQVDKGIVNEQNPDLQLFYLRTQRTLNGWMADYIEMPSLHRFYAERTQNYRDSLLKAEKPGLSRDIVEADKCRAMGQPERAVELLLPYARKMNLHAPDPYICFTLTQAYKALGKEQEANYYLTLTSISDLKRGTTEYQALPMLAQTLYENGDVERAYRYLTCSMEDANLCEARLRAVAVSNIFPIINKQYKQQEKEQRSRERFLTGLLFALLLLLSGGIFYMRKQMKRLRDSRRRLYETNGQLSEVNRKLQETLTQLQAANEMQANTYAELQLADKVKEEYIARYLDRCRNYLDTMEEDRRNALRMMKEHRHDELYKLLKSGAAIKDEQEKFYADFDAAFLTLFPDFIAKFNQLLQPETQIHPKHEGQLNTELRIFALIRLGITDTSRIAHFLNFSLATVYNYRSKMRNRATGDPSEFEASVATL